MKLPIFLFFNRFEGPVHVPQMSITMQFHLIMCSVLRALLFVSPQYFAFSITMFLQTYLVDILVVAIGIYTTIICILAYCSFLTLIWCMRDVNYRIGLREVVQGLIPGRRCGICRYLSIVVLLFMILSSLLYTCWHFSFVRQTWLHEFFSIGVQVLHILPTSLMILTTLGQGEQNRNL